MMPTVISAARAGPAMPETTNGLAAAPPRNARRESESLVMDKLLDGRNRDGGEPDGGDLYLKPGGGWLGLLPPPLFVLGAAPLFTRYLCSPSWGCVAAPRPD